MTSKTVVRKDFGRPRIFSDDDIFRATTRATRRLGYNRLTINAVAEEAGCSGPALMKRFGTKRELLRAFLEWTTARSREHFRTARSTYASPLDALRFRLLYGVRDSVVWSDDDDLPDLQFYVEGRTDPEFRHFIDVEEQDWEAEITSLIDQAIATGELSPCNSGDLAHTLLAGLAGATVIWSPESNRSLADDITLVLDMILTPLQRTGE